MTTRRKSKQEESAYYVGDGNAGEVWLAWGIDFGNEDPYSNDILLDVFTTEQTANQHAEWWHQFSGGHGAAPRATKRTIRTKMKDVS